MREHGEVIALKDDIVTLKVIKKPECTGCKACFFGKGENSSTVQAKNTVAAKVGEHVYFTVQNNHLKASLIVYILPIIFMGLGVLLGALLFKKEVFIVLSAAVGLVIGFLALFLIDKWISKRKNFQIELTGIATAEELVQENSCTSCGTESEDCSPSLEKSEELFNATQLKEAVQENAVLDTESDIQEEWQAYLESYPQVEKDIFSSDEHSKTE